MAIALLRIAGCGGTRDLVSIFSILVLLLASFCSGFSGSALSWQSPRYCDLRWLGLVQRISAWIDEFAGTNRLNGQPFAGKEECMRVAKVGGWLSPALIAGAIFAAPLAHAGQVACSMSGYKPVPGLTAASEDNTLTVTWDGDSSEEQVRMRLIVNSGTPTIHELALRDKGGPWVTVAGNATPEFRVVSGYRRLDREQLPALEASRGTVTQAILDHYKWDAFWDAPLRVPGTEASHGGSTPPPDGIPGTNQLGLPRRPEEIRRVTASYHAVGCEVITDGQRLEISYPGVEMGVFSGRLQYTVYKGTNLIRLEVIAKTDQDSVAYKYDAGLKGLAIGPASKAVWRDTAYAWQDYQLSGAVNQTPSTVRAANRLVAVESSGGSIAAFPPPHNFFWTREISVNLGYNWYRKDSDSSFSFGIRQAESEDDPATAGRGPEDRRQNFALYSARPGTWQRMPIYLLVRAKPGKRTIQAALEYTRNDHYKRVPGYWVMARHFHTSPVLRLLANGGLGDALPDFELARSVGVNVFGPVGPAPSGPSAGPLGVAAFPVNGDVRLKGQAMYYEMAKLQSRKDFLVMPNEEILSGELAKQLGGHTDLLISHPVYWVQGRAKGQSLVEHDPKYGKVYHIGSPEDLMEMTHREDLIIYMPHPDTKGSAGYPEAFKDKDYFIDSNYRGIGFRWGMGIDRSEQRLSDYRCMPLFDDMNNWVANLPTPPKYMDAITETYEQGPGDDFYANSPVSYIKVDWQLKADNWGPIVDAMKKGDYFVTSGEVLIPSYSVQGTGTHRTISADVEWTFPLEFAEVVWGDGQKTDRKIISLTDLPAFGKHHFQLPFDATGKKWVRFAVWDSAGNGAFVQPIKLNQAERIPGAASR